MIKLQATNRKEQHQARGTHDQSDGSASDADGEGAPAADAAARRGRQRRKRARSDVVFSDEDRAMLKQLFEKHGNSKGYADLIREEMGDQFKRSHIQRQLKVLGLRKGQLTDNQVCSWVLVLLWIA